MLLCAALAERMPDMQAELQVLAGKLSLAKHSGIVHTATSMAVVCHSRWKGALVAHPAAAYQGRAGG